MDISDHDENSDKLDLRREQIKQSLREKAELILKKQHKTNGDITNEEFNEIINELQIYDVELEIQNEELRQAQVEVEQSRDRFSNLFHNAPIGYIVLDEHGMVIEANHTFCEMLNLTYEMVLRKPFSKFIIPEDQSIFFSRFKSLYREPIGKVIEIRLTSLDGNGFYTRLEGKYLELNGNRTRDHNKQLLICITDISEIKTSEKALRESEELHRITLNSISDAVIITDDNGTFTYISPIAENMFGYSKNALEEIGNIEKLLPDTIDRKVFLNNNEKKDLNAK